MRRRQLQVAETVWNIVKFPLALFFGAPGCDVSEHCLQPPIVEPPRENELSYSDGYNTVILPRIATRETAEYFLAKTEACKRETLNILGIDTPWNKITFILRKRGDILSDCHEEAAAACAGGGRIFQSYDNDENILQINLRVASGQLPIDNICRGAISVHEMSHAVRSNVARSSCSMIEEGLAVYTERHQARTSEIPVICEETGYVDNGMRHPYAGEFQGNGCERPSTTENYRLFENIGFCFWERIRQGYSPGAVTRILQKMTDFSQSHRDYSSGFPFFETFMNVTGMNPEAAQQFFAAHRVPTSDRFYLVGGICW